MELNTLKDLYIHELKDLFSAERQLLKALPKMAKTASNKELASGFQEHLEQTKGHAQRLEQILSSYKATTHGAKCKGMEGIVAEGAEMIEEDADEEVKDAGLIAAAQRVGHYEMAATELRVLMLNCWVIAKEPNYFKRRLRRKNKPTKSYRNWQSAINVAAAK